MGKIKQLLENLQYRIKLLNPQKRFTYLSIIFFVVFIYFYIFYKLPTPYSLKDYKVVPFATHILDRNGKLLYEIYRDEKRTAVDVEKLPDHVWQATVSTEDKDFFKHRGVSIFGGIFRAVKDTIVKRKLQGGSTITQQLVKSALLTPERTIRRKIKEILLALWTERIYSKGEILEMYLNQVPYGGSSYGIEEASQTYFGKPAKKLSAVKTPISVLPPRTTIKAPHFVFYVKNILEQEYGIRTVEAGGLKVTTTLDLSIQQEAEKVVVEELEDLKGYNVGNAASLVTRPPTGEILAMIGSSDFFATPSGAFNVTTAFRQPGSSIKPLNYAVGIDRKLVTAATVFLDTQTCFPSFPTKYCPRNYDGNFHGPVSLRYALGNSYNIPAVKMLALNGVENFIASASAFTITSFKDPSNYGLSLTLGGGEVKMTEFAQAFSTFPNQGKPRKLNAILKVEDKTGKVLYEYKDPNFVKDINKPLRHPNSLFVPGEKVVSQETAFIISHILLDNSARSAAFGSSSSLVIPKRTVSVKTGTTNDLKDNWTIGYTPNFLTVVWVGNNDNTPMNPALVSGVTGAAPIWNRIMTYVLRNQPDLQPIRPANVAGRQACLDTGAVAEKKEDGSPSCTTRFEYFIRGTEGIKNTFKTEKKTVTVTKDTDKLITDMTGVNPDVVEQKEKTIVTDGYSVYCTDCIGDRPQLSPTPTP
ncbi:penicillin-binding protein [Candidatus Roizmanbacteria bacterium]|nr:penicillin-binding protein [Candidatus Roizmanbacteria bacterium]